LKSMNDLNKTILASHRTLSDCNVRFLSYLLTNREYLERSHYQAILEYQYPRRNYNTQPWPIFINKQVKEKLAISALKVQRLITSIPEMIFSYNLKKMSEYYEIPLDCLRSSIEGIDTNFFRRGLGRGDFILSQNGEMKCVEFNLAPNVAGWWKDRLEMEYLKIPAIKGFMHLNGIKHNPSYFFETLFSYVISVYLKCSGSQNGDINLVITASNLENVSSGLNDLVKIYQTVLCKFAPDIKGRLFISLPTALVLEKNALKLDGTHIQILIDTDSNDHGMSWFALAKKGGLELYNGPVTELMCNKLNLALLSEYQESELFTKEESYDIASHIPWTRKTIRAITQYCGRKIELQDFALNCREQLVLKHATKLGGADVYIGAHTPANVWNQKVYTAFVQRTWVLQERVHSQKFYCQYGDNGYAPHDAIWGLFVFGNVYGGAWVRVAPLDTLDGVINGTRGAEQSIVIEIDE